MSSRRRGDLPVLTEVSQLAFHELVLILSPQRPDMLERASMRAGIAAVVLTSVVAWPSTRRSSETGHPC